MATLSTAEKYESFTHETRFTSSFDGDWQFTAGIFYSDREFDHKYPASFQPGLADAINEATGAPPGSPAFGLDNDLIFVTSSLSESKELAVFGEITYNFNENWALTAGGRWYDTEVKGAAASDGFSNSGPSSFSDKQDESGFNPKVLNRVAGE